MFTERTALIDTELGARGPPAQTADASQDRESSIGRRTKALAWLERGAHFRLSDGDRALCTAA